MTTLRSFDGVPLFVELHGAGPLFALSPGFCTTHENFRPQVAPLVAAGYRVLLWDYRGQGHSLVSGERVTYSMQALVYDLATVLDWASPGEPAVVGGLSLGGLVSLHFALQNPSRTRALVLASTGPGFKREENRLRWLRIMEKNAAKIERFGLDSYLCGEAETMAIGRPPHSEFARRARHEIVSQDPVQVARLAREVAGPAEAVIERLREIAVPSLVLVGENDTAYRAPAEILQARLVASRLVVLPGAGHIANLETPAAFNRALLKFLREQSAP